MDVDDAAMVDRLLAGEAAAFDELVRRHRPRLVRFAAFMIGDADEAESLAQEALTRAYAQIDTFRKEMPFGSWVHGIVLNLCRTHLRDRTRHAKPTAPDQLSDVPAPQGQRQGVLSGILRREMGDQTLHAIGQLPVPLREAFVLHFMDGMDYVAMGQITGIAPGTLRVRAHRARTLLRDSLGSVVDTWLRQSPPRPEAS